ncbi:MAG: protoglobin domain-containing protein, partial [bacterium]
MSSNSLLKQLLSNANPELIDKISSIIKPDAEEIADSFYKYVQLREESAKYLDNMLVQTKLRSSMKQWLEDLFVTRSTDTDVDKYIERQIFIGNRHARINLPIPAMQIGPSTIKREIFRRVILSEMSPQELTEAIVFIDELIDITISVMNQ